MSRTLDCMIVGAQKCGTTSLRKHLAAHPEVVTHTRREFTAFRRAEHSELREAEELDRLLGDAGDRLALAKQAEMYSEPFALDRLRAVSPDCKIILVLRDPVARARSAFRMYALRGLASGTFEEMAAREIEADRKAGGGGAARFLRMSCYGKWLGEILRRFPEDNVKVVFLEEFRKDPAASYEEQCRWLGIDPTFRPDLSVRYNVGADPKSAALARVIRRLRSERNPAKRALRRMLPEETYVRLFTERLRKVNRGSRSMTTGSTAIDERLREYFEADGDELSRLLGRDLPWRADRNPSSS